ncbi:MAG: helix-turn-helix domain-containing protein [Thermoleophilia bacterium]|nr:helix-turn-helix domain-containing protein [Thermoleophilia bacterium]
MRLFRLSSAFRRRCRRQIIRGAGGGADVGGCAVLTQIRSTDEELDSLKALEDALGNAESEREGGAEVSTVVTIGDAKLPIPSSALAGLASLVKALADHPGAAVIVAGGELTSQQAADLLGVSRPFLTRLCDDGSIESYKVGTHRRLRLSDVLAYRARRYEERDAALDEMARIGQEEQAD